MLWLRRKPAFRAILDELAKRQPDRDADNAHIDETPAEITEDKRRLILDDLNAGKITADAAMRMLRGEEE